MVFVPSRDGPFGIVEDIEIVFLRFRIFSFRLVEISFVEIRVAHGLLGIVLVRSSS